MDKKVLEAMELISEAPKVPQKGGKQYTQVQDRVVSFRKIYGFEYGIETKLIKDEGNMILIQAIITDSMNRVIGSGLAEEVRGSSNVNKTSAIENGETSAIGRALASCGLHGGEYASIQELDKVKRIESQPAEPQELVKLWTQKEIDDHIAGFEKHTTIDQHSLWSTTNKPTLDSMKKNDPGNRKKILDAYINRKNTLLNK